MSKNTAEEPEVLLEKLAYPAVTVNKSISLKKHVGIL